MQGYDKQKALSFIARNIDRRAFADLGPALDGYLRQAQALDLQYMRESGVLDESGFSGDGFYDDDDAFEYIVEEIVKLRGLTDEQAIVAATVVDAYMAAQDAFLRMEGLAGEA